MQVLTVAAKATKILGLLKRPFGKCSEDIITAYKAMVHPIVEYASPVWNPHQQYLSDKLEKNPEKCLKMEFRHFH